MADDFNAFWSARHPACPPIGFRLREGGTEHWVGFHALPHAKGRAETDADRTVMLERCNALAGQVLGEAGDCWLVQAFWDSIGGAQNFVDFGAPLMDTSVGTHDCGLPCVGHHAETEGGWRLHAGRVAWKAGAFDDLLTAIADDNAEPTLWVSTGTGVVFAPYDGGVDVFVASAAEADRLRAAYPGWLTG